MTPIELLKLILDPLSKEQCSFALCGGIASGIYRTTLRTTNDIDIAIVLKSNSVDKSEKEFAIRFLESLNIKATLGWIPGIAQRDESNVFLVVGDPGNSFPTIDFILPNLPWVKQAVTNAQENKLDFGFGIVPTITPEDLIISKAFALSIEPNRLQDKLDIDSILAGEAVKDKAYISENLEKFGIKL